MTTRLRVATYNVHKCRGFDRRTLPLRIAAILGELDADVLCLQEVVNAPHPPHNQAEAIASALPEYAWRFGANRPLHGGEYGNMTLSRLPILYSENHDITQLGREPRGVLQTDIQTASGLLHLFNVHLGTSIAERRNQVRDLLAPELLNHVRHTAPRILVGDFNEWTRGLTTKLLNETFAAASPRHALGFSRTFPGLLPFLTLDHCFFDPPLELVETHLCRTPQALIASDHLPLIATFQLSPQPPETKNAETQRSPQQD